MKNPSWRPLEEVQLSLNISTRKSVGTAVDMEEQLRKVIDACKCFSLQFDQSTDMVDVAQLCALITLAFEDKHQGRSTHQHFAIKRTNQWGYF